MKLLFKIFLAENQMIIANLDDVKTFSSFLLLRIHKVTQQIQKVCLKSNVADFLIFQFENLD